MTHYILEYDVIATNVSTAVMATAMAAVPLQTDAWAALDLSISADVTTPFGVGQGVKRTITLLDGGGGPMPPPQSSLVLIDSQKFTFEQALSTPVVSQPVVIV